MPNVVVTADDISLDRLMAPADRDRLNAVANTTWATTLGKASEEEYAKVLSDASADIILSGWGAPRLTRAVMQRNPQLKAMIHLTGQLKNHVDRQCLEDGLVVTNWGDVPALSVAEATLMMTLASLRRACYWCDQLHHHGAWRGASLDAENRWAPQGLFDRTLGLYGFGLIGRAFVKLIKPFGLKPLVFTGWMTDEEEAEYGVERVDSLEALCRRCDVLSVHTGMRDDTRHSLNAKTLSLLPDGSHVINTARGGIIDEQALVAELKSQRLFAALDVFEEEPLPEDHPFRGLPNCMLIPHHGGPTIDYAVRCGATAVDQVERFGRGEPLLHRLSLKQYDRMT